MPDALTDSVAVEFRRRRKKALLLSALPFVLCGSLIAAEALNPALVESATGLAFRAILAIAIAIGSAGYAILFFVYRCPTCNKPIWAFDTSSTIRTTLVFQLNPKQCPQCGVSFS